MEKGYPDGLILCADGVPRNPSFHSILYTHAHSEFLAVIINLQLWPTRSEWYLLLAGVWLGPVKPDMSVILQPILDRIHQEGTTPAGPKCLRAKLLCVLPARANLNNGMVDTVA